MSNGNIIVTGFGPFGVHAINASWESVKLLPQDIDGYNLIKEEIPVSYEAVDNKIYSLWEEYNPKLVIHVGVSSFTNKITLETRAHREGYDRMDHFGKNPLKGNECSVTCTENCIHGGINVQDICDHLNNTNSIRACTSKDAGRYLCEYIFFTSLSVNRDKTMFIHVPPLGQPYSAQELAEGILKVIECALRQQT